jgi:hypothetical protein
MLYCLNPTCSHPENHDNQIDCQGCGEALATSTQSYLFRVHYRITKCLGEGAFGRTYLNDEFGNLQDELDDRNNLEWRWREYLQKQGKKISEELDNILDKMLAVMSINRYHSAREVLTILNSQSTI